jgi:hypothetical protein
MVSFSVGVLRKIVVTDMYKVYVETIEIDADPEASAALERIKQTPI